MKKPLLTLAALLLIALAFVSLNSQRKDSSQGQSTSTLTVYAYDSLTAEWGLLPQVLEKFEKDNNIQVKIVSFEDTGQMLNQLILEAEDPEADVVMGLDNVNFPKVKEKKLFIPYRPKKGDVIQKDLQFDSKFTMTPFDYGFVAFVYDSEVLEFDEAISLSDLATDKYKDKIIIEQPGLSSPGTQLMLWAKAALGEEGSIDFWTAMEETVLTVAPDWNTAYYSLFLEGEAPIVLSYSTSPAYHIDQEGTHRYKAIPITEGYVRQVEGIGIVRESKNVQSAQSFIDFILSEYVQQKIPTTQWIYPVITEKVQLPEAYDQIIFPEGSEILSISPSEIADNYDDWLSQWNTIFKVE